MMIFQRINFHDNKLPVFKENKAKGYITYGGDNLYPDFLVDLFNKSPKHNAIISAKASYVAGIGTSIISYNTVDVAKIEAKFKSINAYETYEELKAKIAYDAELFNGFAVEVIWNKAKTSPTEYYHIPFKDVRKTIDGHFVYCENWNDAKAERVYYMPYNPMTRESKQLYYCQFYRPGQGTYPLPDYVGALKYIEVDTEISNYYLNSIKNGFTAQTHIQLFKGIPTPEEARATARRFKENYQGTDNAGGLIIQYNDQSEKESVISNLQPSDFDKQFDLLNKTVQQEIFVAHKINSPMLFGVRVEGQLGGRSELIEAYEMFHHSYIEPRQSKIDKVFAYLLEPIAVVKLETINKPPVGLDYQLLFTAGVIDRNEARKELGFDDIDELKEFAEGMPHYTADGKLWTGATHRDSQGRLMTGATHTEESKLLYHKGEYAEVGERGGVKESPKAPKSDTPNPNPKGEGTAKGDASTGRGAKVSERAEKILKEKSEEFNEKYKDNLGYGVNVGMLKSVFQRGLGAFNTSHSPKVQSAEQWALARVNAFLYLVKNGRPENPKYNTDYDLLPGDHPKKEKMSNPFGWDDERDLAVFEMYGEKAEEFEDYKFEFADAIETAILNVLKENKGLQVGDIVNITKLDAKVVADAIAKLAKAELIKSYEDGLQTTTKGLDEIKNLQTELVVRYQYGLAPGIDGTLIIDTSRDFCKSIARSNRVYSRDDINMMSAELGYDVWKRRGGWYHNPTLDVNTPQCRHIWVQQLLRRIKR